MPATYQAFGQVTRTFTQGNELVRGTASDGKYTVDAKFSKTAHNALLLLDTGNKSTVNPAGLIKLSDLVLRVIAEPPRLELLVGSVETVPSQGTHKQPASLKRPLSQHSIVLPLINRYSAYLETRKQGDQQSNHSPQSIRSQQPLSPDRLGLWNNETNLQASSLSEPFLTQIPLITERSPPNSPTGKSEAQSPSPAAPPQVTRSKLRKSTGSTSSSVAASREATPPTTTALPISKPLTSPVHKVNAPALSTESEQQKNAPEDHPSQVDSHFQKWRKDSRQSRYLPRYIEKIPEAQLELLESDNAWQSPLVGGRPRSGDVPLSLLEKLSKAADAPSRSASPSDRSQSSQQDDVRLPSRNELDRERQESPNKSGSDATVSDDEWPSSPPTQRRRVYLPPDSDPPTIPEIERQVTPEDQHDETTPIVEMAATEAPPLGIITNDTSKLSLAACQQDNPTSSPLAKNKSTPSGESTHELPEHRQQLVSIETDRTNCLSEVPNGSGNISSPRTDTVRNVQNERSPYVGKIITPPQASTDPAPDKTHITRIVNALPTSPDFVPGTFRESVLKGRTSTGSTLTLPIAKRLSPSPITNSVQHPITQVAKKKQQERHQEQPLFPVQNASLDDDGSELRVLQTFIEDRRDHHPAEAATSQTDPSCHTTPLGGPLPKNLPSVLSPNSPAVDHEQAFPIKDTRSRKSPSAGPQQHSDRCSLITKRGIRDGDTLTPNKRRRISSGNDTEEQLQDPTYAPILLDLQVYRREQFQAFRKSSAREPQPSSSSSVAEDNDVAMPTPPRLGNVYGNTVAISGNSPAHASTPLTGISDADDMIVDLKGIKEPALVGMERIPTYATLESLYRKFARVYPDYQGRLYDFQTATILLKRMVKNETAPHLFLFDDAVFHHFHSYRPFLLEEVYAGEEAMTYDKFYRSRVLVPSHLGRIITVDILKTMSLAESAHVQEVRPRPLQPTNRQIETEACDPALVIQEKGKIRALSPRTSPVNAILAPQNLVQDNEPTQPVSRGQSPELGTPGVDRSRSPELDTTRPVSRGRSPELGTPGIDRGQSPELGTPGVDRSRSDRPGTGWSTSSNLKPLVITHGKPSPTLSQPGRSRTGTPTAIQRRYLHSLENKLENTMTRHIDVADSSANGVTKPARVVSHTKQLAVKKSSPKRIPQWPPCVVSETYEWWKDPDTPVKKFEKQYSALPSEKRQASGGKNGRINIFDWRR